MNNRIITVDRDGKPYIAHYGVQGQKWGVRNYQNADGSVSIPEVLVPYCGFDKILPKTQKKDPVYHAAKK